MFYKMNLIFFLISIYLCVNEIKTAKILCAFPSPAVSHQVVFQPIWKELSLRGHQVTVLTPRPLNDPRLINLTEIDLSVSQQILVDSNMQKSLHKDLPITTVVYNVYKKFSRYATTQLSHPDVQALIKDQTQHFDVLLVEFNHPAMCALSVRFNCPMIGITSVGALLPSHDAVGNPTHPVLNPDILLPYLVNNMGLLDRVYSTLYEIWYRYYYHFIVLPDQDKLVRKYISNNLPYLGDIERNVSMFFLSVNPITYPIRPTVPAVVVLGQIHIQKKKPLPADLQKELDSAKEGVIYFSLGSNVRSANLSVELREKIMKALSEIPYRVLWKWEEDHLPGQPKNVFTRKWLPQQDLLGHPNIKAFVTQGGLQSMEEAISNGVPLIGMPFFGDQPLNVMKMINLGIAQSVDPETLTSDELKAAIIEVAENPKYRNRVKEIGELISDVPMTGLEKAVWWTEYVIRHKGARHLRSPALDMPWYQYLLLDVVAFVLAVTFVALFVLYKIICIAIKMARQHSTENKVKKS